MAFYEVARCTDPRCLHQQSQWASLGRYHRGFCWCRLCLGARTRYLSGKRSHLTNERTNERGSLVLPSFFFLPPTGQLRKKLLQLSIHSTQSVFVSLCLSAGFSSLLPTPNNFLPSLSSFLTLFSRRAKSPRPGPSSHTYARAHCICDIPALDVLRTKSLSVSRTLLTFEFWTSVCI